MERFSRHEESRLKRYGKILTVDIYIKMSDYEYMTSLLNKSNHPVNIKKINIRVWTLRDEIEACIQKRIEEQGSGNIEIEDIKEFYSNLAPRRQSLESFEDESATNFQPGIADSSEMQNEEEDEVSGEKEDRAPEAEDKNDAGRARDLAQEVSVSSSKGTANQSSFKRVKPAKDKMVYGFAFLSEINMEQILLFGKRPYTNGQTIIIEFLIPNRFSVSAEVSNSIAIDRSSKIISQTKPTHRIQSEFVYLFDGERNDLRNFLKSVEPEVPPPPRKIKQVEKDEEEDEDFDDLGF